MRKPFARWSLLLACTLAGVAAHAAAPATAPPSDAARMQWFADAKFGIFIHWGIYAVDGIDESWSFFNGYVSYDHYMQQLKGFTAKDYRPQAWADLIRDSGARYAVMTSKHHDGVALWNTAQGLNVVKDTPARRDLVAPFVAALRKDGLKVGLYFSLIDWSSPDYPAFTQSQPRYDIKNDPARWNRFVRYYQGQLKDLMQRYDPDLYWFDGDWEHSAADWHAKETHDFLLAHNPHAIINARLPGEGDYATPEQGMPVTPPPQPYWELCMTMNDSWGWQPHDHHFKTPNQLIRILADTVSLGGNLLLDIGPRADGSIPEQEVSTLKEIGRWTHKNAEAIYGTRAGIPRDYYAGASTLSKDGQTLYLFVDGRPSGPVLVKGLMNHVLHARVVGNGTTLDPQIVGKPYWTKVPGLLYIPLPDDTLDPQLTVVALTLDGPVQLFHDQVKAIEKN
ncbi:alpha-L-fucosidase [Frateuria sp. YIM B11624]|uniref:alpha-L-fucosidase n=1 Tax=Frateuria sp. YIM B11624 TaxID=3143185 RepID=UPI003C757DEA